MIRVFLLAASFWLAAAAGATEKYSARILTEADSAALNGKVLVVIRHPPGDLDLRAISASFGLIGALVGAKSSDALRGAAIDPTDLFEQELTPVIAANFGLQLKDGAASVMKSKKPREISAGQPDADYLLDLLPTYLRINRNGAFVQAYWVGHGVRVSLIQRDTARAVYTANCYSDTRDHPDSPKLAALAANDAQLFKDVVRKLAWNCLRRVAGYLYLPEGALHEPPAELADPLATYAAAHPTPP
jgi:hypothetical protein